MKKEDFRLANQQLGNLRNELREQPALKTRHFILPVATAFAALMWFLILPSVPVEKTPQANHAANISVTIDQLTSLEKEIDSVILGKKFTKKHVENFKRWKRNKSDKLANRMASTRLRLKKLKDKINS